MLLSHVLDLLRKLQNPNFKFLYHHAKELLVVNYFEQKMVEIYEVNEQKCCLIQKITFKKRMLKFFQEGENVYFIDKFGDSYFSELDLLASKTEKDNSIHEENAIYVDRRILLVTNFFAQIMELYCGEHDPFIILTDDYYKIKIIQKANLQRIFSVSSIRSFFVRRILKIGTEFLFFFDDFKVLPVDEHRLFEIEKTFKETHLIELCTKFSESFFDCIELIENKSVLAVKHHKEEKKLDLFFFDYHYKQKSFLISKQAVLLNIESDFFVIEHDRIHLANDTFMLRDLK